MTKLPEPPGLQRKSAFVEPKVEIVIACEGKVTEKTYLYRCKSEYGAGMVQLRWLPITGVPITVVNAAVEERQRLLELARKSKDSFDVFRVWAVFDQDAHPKVPEALALAKRHKIDVAFSNPCFELWPLLHLEDYGAVEGRHQVQDLLNAKMASLTTTRSPPWWTLTLSRINSLMPTRGLSTSTRGDWMTEMLSAALLPRWANW